MKTDYIRVNDIEMFDDANRLMEYAFTDYNNVSPSSSIDNLVPDALERKMSEEESLSDKFLEDRKRKEEGMFKGKSLTGIRNIYPKLRGLDQFFTSRNRFYV